MTTVMDGGALQTGLGAAIAAAPSGQPAVWVGPDVTVQVYGASRVALTWPQPTAEVTITTPDGEVHRLDGADIPSWDRLAARVYMAADDWRVGADQVLRELGKRQRALDRAERTLTQVRAQRDAVIADAAAQGLSAYRVAHTLGVAESTVGRILSKRA